MYFDIFALGGDRQLARKGHFNACTGGFDAQGVRINGFRLRIEYQRGIQLGGGGGFATAMGAGAGLLAGEGGAKGLAATFTGGEGGAEGGVAGTGKRSLKVFRKATTSSISLSVSAGPALAARLKGTRSRTMWGW